MKSEYSAPTRHIPNGLASEAGCDSFDLDMLRINYYQQHYIQFQPLIKQLIWKYGSDPELRQDLEGEIYCRFCRLIDEFDPDRGVPMPAYLVHQLRSAVYTYVRSQWNSRRREVSLDGMAGAMEDYPVRLSDPSQEWVEDMHREELKKLLPGAIDRLSKRQQQVIQLRYYQGWSFDEIADLMKVRPATVRSLLRHGLNNIRNQFRHLIQEEV